MELKLAVCGLGLALGLCGCATRHESEEGGQSARAAGVKEAMAQLSPTQGNETQGKVTFTKVGDGIRVVADVSGLTPGKHGFHVHEKGDCSAPDASSAGGHFNPTGMQHGGRESGTRHVGDFGNLEADASGKAHAEFVDTQIAFEGPRSILGRGLIVHAQADDLATQPTGNSGGRVACGVIQPR